MFDARNEITRQLAKDWNALPQEEREKYFEKYRDNIEQYEESIREESRKNKLMFAMSSSEDEEEEELPFPPSLQTPGHPSQTPTHLSPMLTPFHPSQTPQSSHFGAPFSENIINDLLANGNSNSVPSFGNMFKFPKQ